jgi:hypothetical protein
MCPRWTSDRANPVRSLSPCLQVGIMDSHSAEANDSNLRGKRPSRFNHCDQETLLNSKESDRLIQWFPATSHTMFGAPLYRQNT